MADQKYNRRSGDHVIEQVSLRIADLHSIIARVEGKLDAQITVCGNRAVVCGQEFKGKVGGTWFRWVLGFVIFGVIAAAGLSADNRVVILEIKKDLVHNVMVTEPKASPTTAIPHETEGDQYTYK